jgi:hypothetical protein
MFIDFDCVWHAFVKVLSVFTTIVADMIATVISCILIIQFFALFVKYYTLICTCM